jgi:hypothetical protein
MKNKMMTAVVCLGLGVVASAQTMTTVHVNLAQTTKVGSVNLPAGNYSIREISNSVIEITSDARKGMSTFATFSQVSTANGNVADRTKVVLKEDKEGNYELQSIWLEGQDLGLEVAE